MFMTCLPWIRGVWLAKSMIHFSLRYILHDILIAKML
jgi:hypothetical protein